MATEPYRPSSGIEGKMFCEDWCYRCKKIGPDDGGGCEILARTLALDENDPAYPTEWICDVDTYPGNPRCTAFEADGTQ